MSNGVTNLPNIKIKSHSIKVTSYQIIFLIVCIQLQILNCTNVTYDFFFLKTKMKLLEINKLSMSIMSKSPNAIWKL